MELELELIQTQMTQEPMLRAEVYARALRASQNRKENSEVLLRFDLVGAPSFVTLSPFVAPSSLTECFKSAVVHLSDYQAGFHLFRRLRIPRAVF